MIRNHLELRCLDVGTPDDPDTLEPGVFVDGHRLGKEHWLDLQALRLSLLGDCGYWLFTCDCFEPHCAGVFDPVVTIHRITGLVLWRVPYEGVTYDDDALLKTPLYWRGFQFDVSQYMDAIEGFFSATTQQFDLQARLRRCHNSAILHTPRIALPHIAWMELLEARRAYQRIEREQIAQSKPGW
jgi:hypothetical protein